MSFEHLKTHSIGLRNQQLEQYAKIMNMLLNNDDDSLKKQANDIQTQITHLSDIIDQCSYKIGDLSKLYDELNIDTTEVEVMPVIKEQETNKAVKRRVPKPYIVASNDYILRSKMFNNTTLTGITLNKEYTKSVTDELLDTSMLVEWFIKVHGISRDLDGKEPRNKTNLKPFLKKVGSLKPDLATYTNMIVKFYETDALLKSGSANIALYSGLYTHVKNNSMVTSQLPVQPKIQVAKPVNVVKPVEPVKIKVVKPVKLITSSIQPDPPQPQPQPKIKVKKPEQVPVIKGDLLKINLGDNDYIVHQTNAVAKKGAGLSKSIFDAYPSSNIYSNSDIDRESMLGKAIIIKPIIAAMGQRTPGGPKSNETKTQRLTWFKSAMSDLVQQIGTNNFMPETLYFPYKIGSGLAKGNWTDYLNEINNLQSMLKINGHETKVIILNNE